MTTELTKISGIGTNTAKDLSEAGFDSIESIANATPESLSEVKGFGAARVTRVISAAKELIEKTETVVAPVVVTEKKADVKAAPVKESSRYWKSGILVPAAAVVFLAFAVIYFGKINISDNFNSMLNEAQALVNGSSEQQSESEQEATEIETEQKTEAAAEEVNAQQTIAQQQIEQVPAWVKKQRNNEPEWVKKQRAEADEYSKTQMSKSAEFRTLQRAKSDERRQAIKAKSDEFRAIQQAKSEEFRTAQKAKAEKQQEESWKRYLASLPPAEANRVAQQKAMADEQQAIAIKQMEVAQERHLAMVEQQKAAMKHRHGS